MPIYEANINRWDPGSLVIHDADAKRPEMLMVVVGYTKDGQCITRYSTANDINGGSSRKRWVNPIEVLHDPSRFPRCLAPVQSSQSR
jgi:hypothetical protein